VTLSNLGPTSRRPALAPNPGIRMGVASTEPGSLNHPATLDDRLRMYNHHHEDAAPKGLPRRATCRIYQQNV
jgi:hypothetical protein